MQSKDAIIVELYNNKQLNDYTKALCNGRFIYEDLYHEFILTINEKTNEQLNELKQLNRLIPYCFVIIRNLNLKRFDKYNYKGKYKALHECSNDNEYKFNEIIDSEYNEAIDENFNTIINHLEKNYKYKSALLFDSLDTSIEQMSKDYGLSRYFIQKELKEIKDELKTIITN
ncbi:MAG: sigma-70 family RNA polymerase sigma factor [Bacteroidia bacterium]|nr:sigma-70 family RNA polymerase sigma factor [Bacteroidia bacterium]